MSVVGAFMVPHPPLIVPEVGRGEERKINSTILAYEEVAREVKSLAPATVVIISPHATAYSDYFHVSPGVAASGSFAQFSAPQVCADVSYDHELVREVCSHAALIGLSAGIEGERDKQLDHGTLVPLYFLAKEYTDFKIVRIGLSGLSLEEHYRLGMLVQAAAKKLDRRVVVIASGDLSHRLKRSGPYGFNVYGPQYDEKIMQVMGSGSFLELFGFSRVLCSEAGECGHRSFAIMAGTLDALAVRAKQLSYEGPFGVGYGVCTYMVEGEAPERNFLEKCAAYKEKLIKVKRAKEDAYVQLARSALETYILHGKVLPVSPTLLPELLSCKAGVFVSLKKDGTLRGCIGTIGPMRDNLAKEIIYNAISAGTQDPRFLEVKPSELAALEYSVDVLGSLEAIASSQELDVQRYGVIVTKGSRTGLLLPNLEGVETIEQQISIAKQKAGIREEESGVVLQRFEVIRHK